MKETRGGCVWSMKVGRNSTESIVREGGVGIEIGIKGISEDVLKERGRNRKKKKKKQG